MAIEIKSSAFTHSNSIPAQHLCDSDDVSPKLSWSGIPEGTKTNAVIMDDPDAPGGTWVHWVAFNIPPTDEISADVALLGTSGSNSWDLTGYGGPCPPSGTHRYVFTVYALDSAIALGEGATKADLLSAIDGHVLGTAQLIGLFR